MLKKYLIPGIFVLPMILHWILPWSIESKLYISILSGKIFIPDLLYLIYLWNYLTDYKPKRKLSDSRRSFIIVICGIILLYTAICLIAKGITYPIGLLISNMSPVWFTLLYMLAPLSEKQVQLTKPFVVGALLFLVCEVLLYSVGILTYTTANNSKLEGVDFGGAMRISTTIGAATGTAIIIGLLGAISISIYKFSDKIKLFLIIITSIGVFYTMSRGTSLIWSIFIIWIFYRDYFIRYSLSKKIKAIMIFIVVISVFYSLGGFDPILARNEHMNQSSNVTADRDSKLYTSLKMISKKDPWGYGVGQVFPEKSIAEEHKAPHPFAPHNAYFLLAIELGWPGLILYLVLFGSLFAGLNYKSDLSWYLLLIFMVNANTESIILDSEFISLILFAIMSVTKYKYPIISSDQYGKRLIYN